MFTIDIKDRRYDNAANLYAGENGTCAIGSDSACDIVLLHENVLPEHLTIETTDSGWRVGKAAPDIVVSDQNKATSQDGGNLISGTEFEGSIELQFADYQLTICRSDQLDHGEPDKDVDPGIEDDTDLIIETHDEVQVVAKPIDLADSLEVPQVKRKSKLKQKLFLTGTTIAACALIVSGFGISFLGFSSQAKTTSMNQNSAGSFSFASLSQSSNFSTDVPTINKQPVIKEPEDKLLTASEFTSHMKSAGAGYVGKDNLNGQITKMVYTANETLAGNLRQLANTLSHPFDVKVVSDASLARGITSLVASEAKNSSVLNVKNGEATVKLNFDDRDKKDDILQRAKKDLPSIKNIKFELQQPDGKNSRYKIQAIWLGDVPHAKIDGKRYYINSKLPGNEVVKSIEKDFVQISDNEHIIKIQRGK